MRHVQKGGLDVENRLHGHPVVRSNSDGFSPVGKENLKYFVHTVHPRIMEGLVVRLETALRTVDASILKYVRENILKLAEAASNNYCNYETQMVWSFYGLSYLTVPCIQ
jgi:hypothetical protein